MADVERHDCTLAPDSGPLREELCMCVCVLPYLLLRVKHKERGEGEMGFLRHTQPAPPASLAAAFQLRAPRAPLDGCLATGTLHHPANQGRMQQEFSP